MVDSAEKILIRDGTNLSNEGPSKKERILAVEIRSQKLGFALFEGPMRLLDYGVSGYARPRNSLEAVVTKRIGPLLSMYVPSVVIVSRSKGNAFKPDPKLRLIVKTITKEATRHLIKLQSLSTHTVRRVFQESGFNTKYEIACALSESFDALAWKLPPRRKPWQSQSYNMLIFDAASLGVSYFAQQADADPKVTRASK